MRAINRSGQLAKESFRINRVEVRFPETSYFPCLKENKTQILFRVSRAPHAPRAHRIVGSVSRVLAPATQPLPPLPPHPTPRLPRESHSNLTRLPRRAARRRRRRPRWTGTRGWSGRGLSRPSRRTRSASPHKASSATMSPTLPPSSRFASFFLPASQPCRLVLWAQSEIPF